MNMYGGVVIAWLLVVVIPHVIALHFRLVLADAASPMTLEKPALQYNHRHTYSHQSQIKHVTNYRKHS